MKPRAEVYISPRSRQVLENLKMLHQQATTEKSHYYVASCCREAIAEITSLLQDKARLDWMQDNACEEGRTMAMPRYSYRVKQWSGNPGPNIRSAVDDAMQTEGNA